jgi:hypothetical protein
MASQTAAGEVRVPRAGPISETADLHVGYQTTDSSGNAGRTSAAPDAASSARSRSRGDRDPGEVLDGDRVAEVLQGPVHDGGQAIVGGARRATRDVLCLPPSDEAR